MIMIHSTWFFIKYVAAIAVLTLFQISLNMSLHRFHCLVYNSVVRTRQFHIKPVAGTKVHVAMRSDAVII